MDTSIRSAREAAHDATARKNLAGQRVMDLYQACEPGDYSNNEYAIALADYRVAEMLEKQAWEYSWKRESQTP